MSIIKYEDYQDLIRKAAWERILRNPDLDYDELMSSGYTAFEKARESWDTTQGKFSTWLTWKCRDYMGRVEQEQKKNNERYPISLDDPEACPNLQYEGPGQYEHTRISQALATLSQEALQVVHMLFTIPEELVDWTTIYMKISKTSIRRYLHSLGWKPKKINRAFSKIERMLINMDVEPQGKAVLVPWWHPRLNRWIYKKSIRRFDHV